MNYTMEQIEHVQAVARESERLEFIKFLELRHDELTALSNEIRATDAVKYEQIEARIGELMTVWAWALDRDDA